MSNLTQWLSNEIHSNFPKTVRDLITLPPQGIEGYAYNPLIRAKMLEQLSAIDHWIWLARSTNDLAQFRVCLTYFGDNLIQSTDSRDFGPITSDEILSKVILKIWSKRISRFFKNIFH